MRSYNNANCSNSFLAIICIWRYLCIPHWPLKHLYTHMLLSAVQFMFIVFCLLLVMDVLAENVVHYIVRCCCPWFLFLQRCAMFCGSTLMAVDKGRHSWLWINRPVHRRATLFAVFNVQAEKTNQQLHTVNVDKLVPTHSNWMPVKRLLVLVRSLGWDIKQPLEKWQHVRQLKTLCFLLFYSFNFLWKFLIIQCSVFEQTNQFMVLHVRRAPWKLSSTPGNFSRKHQTLKWTL